jgi:hypothetical protein
LWPSFSFSVISVVIHFSKCLQQPLTRVNYLKIRCKFSNLHISKFAHSLTLLACRNQLLKAIFRQFTGGSANRKAPPIHRIVSENSQALNLCFPQEMAFLLAIAPGRLLSLTSAAGGNGNGVPKRKFYFPGKAD